MRVFVEYEDTKNRYEVPLGRLLKALELDVATVEAAIIRILNET